MITQVLYQLNAPIYLAGNGIYFWCFTIVPILTGVIFLFVYNRKTVWKELKEIQEWYLKPLKVLVQLLVYSMASWFSIGLLANLVFHIIQFNATNEQSAYMKFVEIKGVTGGNKALQILIFDYEGRVENIRISRSIRDRITANSADQYILLLTTKEGIWDYDKLIDYRIKEKPE
jgi:uncharacterized membrane protein YjfL (UPF0719 family)